MLIVILIISAILVAIGYFITRTYDTLGFCLVIIFIIVFMVTAIAWPVKYYEFISDINKFKATQQTISESRKDMDSIERATLTQKIIEQNQWLANMKYWNKTIFDQAIPDEVDKLEMLR